MIQYTIVYSHAPSVRSHRGTEVVFPDFHFFFSFVHSYVCVCFALNFLLHIQNCKQGKAHILTVISCHQLNMELDLLELLSLFGLLCTAVLLAETPQPLGAIGQQR
jgi:hypothetical protein